jgi:LacI family transcriptional regulator
MSKEITIYDIAKELSLSPATISRGLNNSERIKKATIKRITEKAEEMGYRPNNFASNLRNKKTHTLGVIVPRLTSNFMSSVLAGMENAASRQGYNLIITQSLEKQEKEKTNAQIMFNKRVDGLLVSLAYDTNDIDHFTPFTNKKIPIVFFDRAFPKNDCVNIVIDNYRAAYDITCHLLQQGCRRIMHIAGNLRRDIYKERLRGYRDALSDHSIVYDESLVLVSELNEEAGNEAAMHILTLKPGKRPDAVFGSNDTVAVNCLIYLKSNGIKIPGDIAFAGFNNDPISKVVEPNLTTVNYDGFNMGEVAIHNMINILNDRSGSKNTDSIILRSPMIIRESSLKKKDNL